MSSNEFTTLPRRANSASRRGYLRPAHLAQLRRIIDQPESSGERPVRGAGGHRPTDNQPLTVAATELTGHRGQGWNLVTAGGFFTMIVPILEFLGLQRFFVRGLTAGAVEG